MSANASHILTWQREFSWYHHLDWEHSAHLHNQQATFVEAKQRSANKTARFPCSAVPDLLQAFLKCWDLKNRGVHSNNIHHISCCSSLILDYKWPITDKSKSKCCFSNVSVHQGGRRNHALTGRSMETIRTLFTFNNLTNEYGFNSSWTYTWALYIIHYDV